MLLDSSASSLSKSPIHYAHTDGGVSAIRCLDQSVDESPDSPAPVPPESVPSPDPLEASVARTFAVQGLARVGKAVSSREPLNTDCSYFPLTERGLPAKIS